LVAGKTMVLPQGGVGPLTAQATSVEYCETPFFEVEYLSAREVNRVCFALEQALERQHAAGSGPAVQPNGSDPLDVPDDWDEKEDSVETTETGEQPETSRRDAYARRARLIIRGDQTGDLDLPYLIDGLRLALGGQSRFGSPIA